MEKALKIQEVKELTKAFQDSSAVFCADYRGLKVSEFNNLRRELEASNAFSIKVTKNTFLRLAFSNGATTEKSEEKEKFLQLLKGPTFVVFANDDVVAPAKIFDKYSKDKECFTVKGGWFGGSCVNAAGVEQISKLPSREETLSSLLRLMKTPATQLVRVLNAPAQQLVQVLSAFKDKLS